MGAKPKPWLERQRTACYSEEVQSWRSAVAHPPAVGPWLRKFVPASTVENQEGYVLFLDAYVFFWRE